MTAIEQRGGVAGRRSTRLTRLQQEARIGWLFLSPRIIGFVLLKALPILAALILSLTDFKMLTPEATSFVGLENYILIFMTSIIPSASIFFIFLGSLNDLSLELAKTAQ